MVLKERRNAAPYLSCVILIIYRSYSGALLKCIPYLVYTAQPLQTLCKFYVLFTVHLRTIAYRKTNLLHNLFLV